MSIQKKYNSLTNLVRRIITSMKTNEFRTSLIMVLIALAFATIGQAINYTSLWVKIPLDVVGVAMIVAAVILWNVTWKRLKKDDDKIIKDQAQERQEHHNTDAYFQSLISEVKGLRQDITGMSHDLTRTDNDDPKKNDSKT